jgi:hypothetical protein
MAASTTHNLLLLISHFINISTTDNTADFVQRWLGNDAQKRAELYHCIFTTLLTFWRKQQPDNIVKMHLVLDGHRFPHLHCNFDPIRFLEQVKVGVAFSHLP